MLGMGWAGIDQKNVQVTCGNGGTNKELPQLFERKEVKMIYYSMALTKKMYNCITMKFWDVRLEKICSKQNMYQLEFE